MVIRSVGALSCAKIVGTMYAVLGLIFGALFSVVAVLGGFAAGQEGPGALGAMFGAAAVVVFPICYGALGFVMSLIGAWLYNVFAGMVGGVEVDVS
jgi:hypothetical protein